MKEFFSLSEVADLLSVSKETLRRWDASGKLVPIRHPMNKYRVYPADSLKQFQSLGFLFDEPVQEDAEPLQEYTSMELFAGAGGLALGFEKAGFHPVLLNEINKDACETLKRNRPNWNVEHGDISEIDFRPYKGMIDVIAGGFPCQAFSYAGKKLGIEDTRGTLFYEFARAIQEAQPAMFVAENVRGLLTHEGGRTISVIMSVFQSLGYEVLDPKVVKAIFHRVPQKRERLILIGMKKGLGLSFEFPRPHKQIYTVKDALKKGRLFNRDAPKSPGQAYPPSKRAVMEQVPPGGYWRDLPLPVQKAYMKKSFYLGGGKTGMARRMSWDEPSLTLTCAPAQKQTERCHPEETRPFTVREYARIQTFPDDWEFAGSVTSQYAQIGNAVPVNMAEEIAQSVVRSLNAIVRKGKKVPSMNAQKELALA
jgi:DNA (cytosine-5)-methyltransferase 1